MFPMETAGNRFLMSVPADVSERIAGQLDKVALKRGQVLAHAGANDSHLYFPDRGLVALVKTMRDGRTAEVGCIGIEGIVGLAALLGLEKPTFERVVQMEGSARAIRTSVLRAETERSPQLRELVLRYVYYSLTQFAQTAACNRLHTLRQRCCRWLLLAQDNAQATTFELTHEFLALMMGVNRPALSLAVAALQRYGLIKYARGSLTILDRSGLQQRTCECYHALREHCERIYRS